MSLVPFTEMLAAWPRSPVPFFTAYVKEVVMPAFPVGMVFVYLRCGVFFREIGSSVLLVSFPSSLSECAPHCLCPS